MLHLAAGASQYLERAAQKVRLEGSEVITPDRALERKARRNLDADVTGAFPRSRLKTVCAGTRLHRVAVRR